MLQVIKMPHNDPHKEVKDSIRNSIENLLVDIQDRDVTGFCFVLMEKDGSSTFYESAGLERQRRIGILMDMIYELLRK